MLIYDFSRRGEHPLYEYLYHCLKEDILSGRIPAGTKLPSKRELAADNQISIRTVMNAYDQLLTEGYITAEEKRGYFAAKLETAPERSSFPPVPYLRRTGPPPAPLLPKTLNRFTKKIPGMRTLPPIIPSMRNFPSPSGARPCGRF